MPDRGISMLARAIVLSHPRNSAERESRSHARRRVRDRLSLALDPTIEIGSTKEEIEAY